MTSTLSSPSTVARRSTHRAAAPPHGDRARTRTRREQGIRRKRRVLGRYSDRDGRPREVIAQPGLAASVLVVDRDVVHREDRRLVAHLGADEPAENAELVCER